MKSRYAPFTIFKVHGIFRSESLKALRKTRTGKAKEPEDPKRSEGDGGGLLAFSGR